MERDEQWVEAVREGGPVKTLIEIVGNTQTFFREILENDLRDIARTFSVDLDLNAAHKSVWDLSVPFAIESTGNIEFSVIDDSNDQESCQESWLDIHAAFEDNDD